MAGTPLSEAVNALYRIRAVEKPPDAEGVREVWHHCAQGAELISFVRGDGRVMRQELALLADYFRWTSQYGLQTGSLTEADGSKAAPASARVMLDLTVSRRRVETAAEALRFYQGDDKYLAHVRKVLLEAERGLQVHSEETLTTEHRPVSRDDVLKLATPEAPRRDRRLMLAVLVGAAVVGVGAALLYWMR